MLDGYIGIIYKREVNEQYWWENSGLTCCHLKYSLFTIHQPPTDLSIEGSLPDIISISADFILLVLFTGDKHYRGLAATGTILDDNLILLAGIIKKIDRLCRAFLWNGKEENKMEKSIELGYGLSPKESWRNGNHQSENPKPRNFL